MDLGEIYFILCLNFMEFDGIVTFQFNNQRIVKKTIAAI